MNGFKSLAPAGSGVDTHNWGVPELTPAGESYEP